MSRIEKALEKAVEMRKTLKGVTSEETPSFKDDVVFKGFDVEKPVINLDRVDNNIVCIKDPASSISEQYKKLRARIIKDTSKDFLNTIMITSPDIGDGKTITAINLAVAIANEMDHTVLLVDADLRNPTIHKYLGIESRYGLSDYLMGKTELSDIIIKTGVGKLFFMPGGNSSDNAVELISSERMKRLVQDVKHRYKDRYVIFDSSPVIVAAESLPLSSFVDCVVLVVQATRTTPKTASHAISLIKGSKILGIVFNNVPEDLARNLYPYYYHYGYKKSKDVKSKHI